MNSVNVEVKRYSCSRAAGSVRQTFIFDSSSIFVLSDCITDIFLPLHQKLSLRFFFQLFNSFIKSAFTVILMTLKITSDSDSIVLPCSLRQFRDQAFGGADLRFCLYSLMQSTSPLHCASVTTKPFFKVI